MSGGTMLDPSTLSGDTGMFGANQVGNASGGNPFSSLFGGGAAPTQTNLGRIDSNKLSGQFGESDPMGMMPAAQGGFDPKRLQAMLALRSMLPQQQQSGGMQGAPAPQIQPQGALMGAMPQMPQAGFRPRGMAGRF